MGTMIKLTLGTWRQEITSSDWRLAYIDEESGYAWIPHVPMSSGMEYSVIDYKIIPKNKIEIIGKCKIKTKWAKLGDSAFIKQYLNDAKYWPILTAEELDRKWENQFCNHDLTDYYPYLS